MAIFLLIQTTEKKSVNFVNIFIGKLFTTAMTIFLFIQTTEKICKLC
jgi:hypothetical protein